MKPFQSQLLVLMKMFTKRWKPLNDNYKLYCWIKRQCTTTGSYGDWRLSKIKLNRIISKVLCLVGIKYRQIGSQFWVSSTRRKRHLCIVCQIQNVTKIFCFELKTNWQIVEQSANNEANYYLPFLCIWHHCQSCRTYLQ